MAIEIIPAILPQDFDEITEKVELVKGLVKTVQIDICDGHFVPSFTWPYKGGLENDLDFKRLAHEDEGLPAWQNIDYEFDLMVDNPEKVVEEWVVVGASRIIIHAEAKGDIRKAIDILKDRVEIGLAFNVETPIETIEEYRDSVQFIQCMGIDRVGFQGQPFDEKVLGKIKDIRLKYHGLPISVDGGVSLETAPDLIAAGADRLVAGSALFDSENLSEVIRKFKQF